MRTNLHPSLVVEKVVWNEFVVGQRAGRGNEAVRAHVRPVIQFDGPFRRRGVTVSGNYLAAPYHFDTLARQECHSMTADALVNLG